MTAPDVETRVRASFGKQRLMTTIGALVDEVATGRVVLRLPFREDLTQQHGYLHAGTIAALADSACGYAALTLMPLDAAVLSVEFKVNLLAPADGDLLRARGKVTRSGRTLTVCSFDADVRKDGKWTPCATGIQTLMCLPAKAEGRVAG